MMRRCCLVHHPHRITEHHCALSGGGLYKHPLHHELTRLPCLLHEDQVAHDPPIHVLGHHGRRAVAVPHEGCRALCSPKHPPSSHDQVLLHCHSKPGQLDHLMELKDQRWPRQSNKIIDYGQCWSSFQDADTAHSFGEEGSMWQLETHHHPHDSTNNNAKDKLYFPIHDDPKTTTIASLFDTRKTNISKKRLKNTTTRLHDCQIFVSSS